MSALLGRCGRCMDPYRNHRERLEAAPLCPDLKGTYREAIDVELDAGYDAAFPNGPEPIATVTIADLEAAKAKQAELATEAGRTNAIRDAIREATGRAVQS